MNEITLSILISISWVGIHFIPGVELNWSSVIFPLLWLIINSWRLDKFKEEKEE